MDDTLQRVKTKGSELKKNCNFEAVIFTSRKKGDQRENMKHGKTQPANSELEFDIKKATKEVIRLGAKGFYSHRRDRTLKALAIELGAKPEKKRYHNYKELKEIRTKNRQRKEERIKLLNLSTKNQFKKPKRRDRKSKHSILNNYGKSK